MKSFRLALSLILVPRLFLMLVFFPLIFSLIVLHVQLFITAGVVNLLSRDSVSIEKKFNEGQNYNLFRKVLYGDAKRLPALKVCKWASGKIPSLDCIPDRLDVTVRDENLSEDEISRYIDIFQGNVRKLHLCNDCTTDVVISPSSLGKITTIRSVWGLMISSLCSNNQEVAQQYVKAVKKSENLQQLLGDQFFHVNGLSSIRLSEFGSDVIFMVNICGLLIIAVWLALKAHKKILDYFSKSGALLPLVAATGKDSFYKALWIITALRVLAFLITALPITLYTLIDIFSFKSKVIFLNNDPLMITAWLITILFALSFAALIASISDLKQRYNLLGVMYKFIPLLLCLGGALIWSVSFLAEGSVVNTIRMIVTSIPVVGLAPVLVSPVIKPSLITLFLHSIFTIYLFKILLQQNSRWFAAHLEDI